MVSPTTDPLQMQEEPLVEQHFPRKLSWYAAETPDTWTERTSLWVRENPWPAISLAMAGGFVAGVLVSKAMGR